MPTSGSLIERLAALIPDDRDPNQMTHTLADLMRARVFAIACGHPDANDVDTLPLCQTSCRLNRIGTFGGADIRKRLETHKRTKIG